MWISVSVHPGSFNSKSRKIVAYMNATKVGISMHMIGLIFPIKKLQLQLILVYKNSN